MGRLCTRTTKKTNRWYIMCEKQVAQSAARRDAVTPVPHVSGAVPNWLPLVASGSAAAALLFVLLLLARRRQNPVPPQPAQPSTMHSAWLSGSGDAPACGAMKRARAALMCERG